jgi:formylglycine-generating enzyme required for sulfatase activity
VAFCIWDNGFLPSEAEANYVAAGGSAQRPYPWGATVPGADATLAVYGCYFNGTGTCSGVTNIAPVGSVAAGNGLSYGHADLSGNVWEWTLDWFADPPKCNDCANIAVGTRRALRGGSFDFMAQYAQSTSHWDGGPGSRNRSYGLRCARAP